MQEKKRNLFSIYQIIIASNMYSNYIENIKTKNQIDKKTLFYTEISLASLILFLWSKTTYKQYYSDMRLLNIIGNFYDKFFLKNKLFGKQFAKATDLLNYLSDSLMYGLYIYNNEFIILGSDETKITIKQKDFLDFIKDLTSLGNILTQENSKYKYLCTPLYKIPKKDYHITNNSHFNEVIKNLICLQYQTKLQDESISMKDYHLRLNIILNTLKNEITKAFHQKKGIECNNIIRQYKNIFAVSKIDFKCDLISSRYQEFLDEMNIYYYENKEYFISLSYEEQYQIIEQKFLNFIKNKQINKNLFQIIANNLSVISQLKQSKLDLSSFNIEDYEDLRFIASFNLFFNTFLTLNYISSPNIELSSLYNNTEFDFSKLDLQYFGESKKINEDSKISVIELINQTRQEYNLTKMHLQKMRQIFNNYLKKNQSSTLKALEQVILELHNKILAIQSEYESLEKQLNYYNNYIETSFKDYVTIKDFFTQINNALKNCDYDLIYSKRYNRNKIPVIHFTLDDNNLKKDLYLSVNELSILLNKNNLKEVQDFLENNQVLKR